MSSGSVDLGQTFSTTVGDVNDVTATSPLTSSGGATPDISFLDQLANKVLAGPTSGGAAAPAFRSLVTNDLPSALTTRGHFTSTQSGTTTVAAQAGAGTGASASLAHATDVAGTVTLTSGSGSFSAGAIVKVTFAAAYSVAPIVLLTPANVAAAQDQSQLHEIYVTSTVNDFTINFGQQPNTNGKIYIWNYFVIQTQ